MSLLKESDGFLDIVSEPLVDAWHLDDGSVFLFLFLRLRLTKIMTTPL